MNNNICINEQIFDGRTAGEMLKAARTTGRRKREIQTIARQLCIREDFLEALESCNYTKIPELVYILGFARNYAMELELDPKLIIGKIKYEMGIIQPHVEEEENTEISEIIETPIIMTPDVPRKGTTARATELIKNNIKIVIAGVCALVILLVGISVFSGGGKERVIYAEEYDVSETGTAQTGIQFRIPVRESFGTANRANATVVLQATAESWVMIEDARGQTLFSRVLTRGDIYYVPVANVRATVGNAGGIDVWVNGRLAPALGADNARRSGIVMTPAALMGN